MGRRGGEEQQRYRLLFERHWRRVSAYVHRRCPDPAAADDVVADVFLIVWRRIDDIPAEHELPWLFGVARRALANSLRSAARRQQLVEKLASERPDASGDSGASVNGHDPDTAGTVDLVQRALAQLRPVDAEILRLSAWEELTPSQIAVVMGCSPNAAAVRLHRARMRLSDILQDLKVSGRSGHVQVTDVPPSSKEAAQ